MGPAIKSFSQLMNAAMLLAIVTAVIAAGVALLILYFVARRAWEHFQTRRFDALSFKIHSHWREMVRGSIPAEGWRTNALQCEILQSIVIQEIGAATDKDRAGLQQFLRTSGLPDLCIERVHRKRGWSRRRAMLALGAMRVREGIAPLAEALDDWQLDTRMAAVQALGRSGFVEAGEAIIDAYRVGKLKVPGDPVANALVRCYMAHPTTILPYLRGSVAETRELLARVASEIATAEMADEMLLLSQDLNPEVRACAAKALAVAPLALAIPALANLAHDVIWFVRLRAVTALSQISHSRAIPTLLEALRDYNRTVRMRAAAALARFEPETVDILQSVVDSHDRYALHAMISAIELGGGFEKIMEHLNDPRHHSEAAARLVQALREGAAEMWTARSSDVVVEQAAP